MSKEKVREKGKEKPHLVKDMLSKEWAAIHTPLKGFGETPSAALQDLDDLKQEAVKDPFGF